MSTLASIRRDIRAACLMDEAQALRDLQATSPLTARQRQRISERATSLVLDIRAQDEPGMMESFLAEYGLSTKEGIALMCLAEALLRVPDAETIDELIEDKIAPAAWGRHLGQSSSSLVNASTWALLLTGKVLNDASDGMAGILQALIKRVGEPVIRVAVRQAMSVLGGQFVLGETIESAMARGAAMEEKGYTYSYDMLGEAALTARDARAFYEAYQSSIRTLSEQAGAASPRDNPGISIKLSALHPRYEVGQKARVMDELVEHTLALTLQARDGNLGLNIDAEEADRLDLSLDVIEAVLRDPRLAGWDGFGVVVQAYGKRAPHVIQWLHQLAEELDRKIMVRLVKGAYWDAEIKRAQVEGLTNFPVFTHKAATDVSYLCCAQMLLGMTQRIFPQFATHNAHTVSAILELAENTSTFEFQRLHGMGEALHQAVLEKENTHCRIYAPVGAHEDLLAYLVRRLLENGANSSFVNQIVDTSLPAETVAADPFEAAEQITSFQSDIIRLPAELYGAERANSRGWDLHNEDDLEEIDAARTGFQDHKWTAEPLLAIKFEGTPPTDLSNPADPSDHIGQLIRASEADTEAAIAAARAWTETPASDRAAVLTRASELYEENFGELFAALAREAGKTPLDAVAELREAVDFLRYYGAQAALLPEERTARGVIACISPWNFPLAIFTGQIAAALAAGNAVLAKPADPTPVIATIAVKLMHKAGVPKEVLQLLPGRGSVVGAKLTSSPRINGFCFTGSTATAMTVNRSMAEHLEPQAPLIAETGGLNAMIVDSTALPEQAVRDIIASAFQSAGQRCSALRILFLQEDIAESFEQMLFGAMDELVLGDPWAYATDVGPVITQSARAEIEEHIDQAATEGRLLKRLRAPSEGTFVGPAVLRVNGMKDMQREIFGPVLHIATFKAHEVDDIVADINRSGYGLTFGLHTRIDDRVEQITSALNVGNMYINRNQIGAIVGSQPFGGEGLSGTGPKAGGPRYVRRFTTEQNSWTEELTGRKANPAVVQSAIDRLNQGARKTITTLDLPGPTGESNRWSLHPRGVVLCLGPSLPAARKQAEAVKACGGIGLVVAEGADAENEFPGILDDAALVDLQNIAAVILWSTPDHLATVRRALARREGPLIPVVCETGVRDYCLLERHICIDTTAAGGNASLLAASSEPSFAEAPLRQSA